MSQKVHRTITPTSRTAPLRAAAASVSTATVIPRHPGPEGPKVTGIVSLVLNLLASSAAATSWPSPGRVLAGLSLGRSSRSRPRPRACPYGAGSLFVVGFALTFGTFLFLGLNGYLDD